MVKPGFTSFTVQFTLPVDNPVSNVRVRRQQKHLHFEVPINHPLAHSMGLSDLLNAADAAKLLTLSTHLNTEKVQ